MTEGFPRTAALVPRLEERERTGSTNADLRALADDRVGWPHLSVLMTRHQTAGRGRLDRSWVAPEGAALAVSVLLRRLPAIPERGWIPLLAGAAMADAVAAAIGDHDVAVKWPNDVLVDGRKICGILAEASGAGVIVGAGVNTAMTAEQLPVPTATSFAVVDATVDEDALLAAYISGVDRLLALLLAGGDAVSSGLHEIVSSRCSTLGGPVRVVLPGDRTLEGTATGIDREGRLLVVADGVEHAVGAGDVVHVRRSGD